MNNFYKIIVAVLFTTICYGQRTAENLYVDKAWVNNGEEWSSFGYQGQIVVSTTAEEGNARITNYDFLRDLCESRANFSDKTTYTSAKFENKRKVSSQTDKKGIVSSIYEGVLIFQSGSDYYSTFVVLTFLEKGYVVGLKVKEKNNNKEYAFSFKPNNS